MIDLAQFIETATLFLVAYLLGCILGYATRRLAYAAAMHKARPPAPAPIVQPPKRVLSPAARLAATVDEPLPPIAQPIPIPVASPPQPKPQPPDNLRLIKGIGPKIESSLHALGVVHLSQIAAWTPADIARIDGHLAFKGRIGRERWVEQATALIAETER